MSVCKWQFSKAEVQMLCCGDSEEGGPFIFYSHEEYRGNS